MSWEADQARSARQQDQMNQMKMQEFQRVAQGDRTLADIFAQQQPMPEMLPGQSAIPEQVMPENVLGPPRPATPETSSMPNPENNPLGRLEHQSQQRRAAAQKMAAAGFGAMAQKIVRSRRH